MAKKHIKDDDNSRNLFLERLTSFIESNYDSRSQFCSSIGIGVSTVSGYFAKRKSSPGLEFFEAVLKVHPDLDLAWLVSGHLSDVKKTNGVVENRMGDKILERMGESLDQINETLKVGLGGLSAERH